MTNCVKCGHCTWVHEYECYICTKRKRLPFVNITTDPEDCPEFEEYKESHNEDYNLSR